MNTENYSCLCHGPFDFRRAVLHMYDAAGVWVVKHSPEKKYFAINISSRMSLAVTSCDLVLDYYFINEKASFRNVSSPLPLLWHSFLSSQDYLTRCSFRRSRSMPRWPSKTKTVKKDKLGCICVPLKTTLNVDFEVHHLRKSWGLGLISNWYLPSHVYDRHFSFSLLVVFSNRTTVSLFRWQPHSKRRSSHPSAGIGRSSGFKAQSKVFPRMLFLWEHADSRTAHPPMCQPII